MRYFNQTLMALAAVGILTCSPVWAQAPQSDDWSQGKLQSFWTFEAIGDNQGVEAQGVKSGDLVMTAGGADVWSAPDNFTYAFQKVSGNFRVTVKVEAGSLEAPADTFSKAGLMIRSTDDPSAAYTYLFESPRRSGILWEMRQDDAGTNQGQAPSTQQLPAWLRFTRLNGVIIPSYSSDGIHYLPCGSFADANQDSSITSPVFGLPGLKNDPVLVGIATTAHNTTLSATANYGPFVAAAVKAGTISGTATTADGKPFANGTINLVTADGTDTEAINTDADGKYSIPVVIGDWNVSALSSTGYANPVAVSVAENATATANLTINPLAAFSWTSDSTDTAVSAKLLADVSNSAAVSLTDWSPINPTFDDKNFVDITVPEDEGSKAIATNASFWYRIKFKIPTAFQSAKGSMLYLSGFNMDDSDVTFVNGHYVGNTLNTWDAKRNYMVPTDFINWDGDNVISIMGTNGGGGAGFNKLVADGYTPVLHQAAPFDAGVYGKVVTDKGGEVGGIAVTLKSADGLSWNATSNFVDGSYKFSGLKAGSYTLAVGSQSPAPVTVEAGKAAIVADTKLASITSFGPADLADVDVSKLKNVDIGASGDAGTVKATGNNVTLTAGGADIWNNADDFSFAQSPDKVSGDFTAVVSAVPGEGSSDWAKAGVMVRATNDAGAQNVTALNGYYYGTRLQWRDTVDGASNSQGNNIINNLGNLIMLTRQGDVFSAYLANSDGSNATLIGQQTIAGFPKDLEIGLAATSHAAATLVDATFSGFKLSKTAFVPGGGVTPGVKGDLNGDGKVNIADATMALQFAVGNGTPTAAQIAAGDVVGGDGKIGIPDVTKILQAAIGAINL